MNHSPVETLDRHCHDRPFVTVVLAGGYVEAGDEGRHRLGAGEVLVHRAFESHLDRFDAHGASVLILPAPEDARLPVAGRCADPDFLVRLAERDPREATAALLDSWLPGRAALDDWPDRLAADLQSLQSFRLDQWAITAGLRPETVSRGFRLAYGTSPKQYRATSRARAAHAAITAANGGLASIAAELGYADQAHMTRAVAALTGAPPSAWIGSAARRCSSHDSRRARRAHAAPADPDPRWNFAA